MGALVFLRRFASRPSAVRLLVVGAFRMALAACRFGWRGKRSRRGGAEDPYKSVSG